MHGLDVIFDRNIRASARECAHAVADEDFDRANAIASATPYAWVGSPFFEAFRGEIQHR